MSTRSRPMKTLLTLLPVLLLLAAIATGISLTQPHHSAHAAESCGTVIGRVNPSTDGYANLEITIATGYAPRRIRISRCIGNLVQHLNELFERAMAYKWG